MTTIDYKVYDAHEKQARFHAALLKYSDVLFNGGRGSGKTTSGAIQSILEATQYQPASRGVVVAPTYPMLEDSSMREFFEWLPRHFISDFNKQRKLLTLINGSEVAFRSAENPESLRGPNRTWAWLDEPRNLRTREAFDIISAQLRPIRRLWLTTTPSGIFHWIYDLFYRNPLPNSKIIKVKTSENPHVPAVFETSLRTQYTGLFAMQELDAEWVSFEGLIFDNFNEENVTVAAEYDPTRDVIWGVDDGYAKGEGVGYASYHPRVVLLGQVTPQGGMNIFYAYYRANELSERTINTVLELPYKRPELAYVDSSADELIARLNEMGIQSNGATHRVSEGIKNVRRMICDGNGVRLLKIHPRCVQLINELQSYRYDDQSKVASVGEPKPMKLDDHGPDSLRYLTWHLRYND